MFKTIDRNTLPPPEQQKDLIYASAAACNSVASGKKHIFLRGIAWYGFWLAIVLALYWPVLPALPYRDHPFLMLNHQLWESDWAWFWSMLSYARTRVLLPGDYFAFRPLHYVVIALQDIFLRYDLIAQGVVNCAQFAFAATVFSSLVKRYVGRFTALALTFLWISQLAGISTVMWQHITTYILCPAFFVAALRSLDGDDLKLSPRAAELTAAACVFAATLTHELGVMTALSVSALVLLCGRHDAPRRNRILMVFLLPAILSLLLNLVDYFIIHRPPSLMGPADVLSSQTTIVQIAAFVGAIGAAFTASPLLHLSQQAHDYYPVWEFYNESPVLLTCMALFVSALLLLSCVVAFRELKRDGLTRRALVLVVLLSFFLATFSICAFRMYSRDIHYMSLASYYYSLFSLALGGLVAALLYNAKKNIIAGTTVIALILSVFHVTASRSYFRDTREQRNSIYNVVTEGRKILTQNPALCFNGFIPTAISYSSLFHDLSCVNRPQATPLYIQSINDEVWLTSALYTNNSVFFEVPLPPAQQLPGNNGWVISRDIPRGHDLQFTANRVGELSIVLSNQTGIQQSFIIERNLLKKVVWPDLMSFYGSLDMDSAASKITYQLGFSQDGILLFANGRWIGELPSFANGNVPLNLVLRTTDNKPADIGGLLISERPSMGNLQIFPRINLVKK